MLAAIIISIVSSLGGLLVATIIDVPCSAIIVLLQVALYFVARIGKDISLKRPIR
jgi:ABC-type Mn2+/Zn2+ transport system permease subunit